MIFVSCEKKTNNVQLDDESVLQTIDLSFNDIEAEKEIFLGEFSPGQESIPIEVQIFNSNEKYHIEEFNLEFVEQSSLLKFYSQEGGQGVFPGDGGNCTKTLDSLETCKAFLEFSPIQQGEFKFQVKAKYLNLLGPKEHTMTFSAFVGLQGELQIVENIGSLDFGVLANSKSEYIEKVLTVKNIGQITVENIIADVSIVNEQISDFQISENNCPDTLSPEAQCELKIKFKPRNENITDDDNFHAASLVIDYERDSAGTSGTLTKPMRAYSTRIEAKFRLLGNQSHDFDDLIQANTTTKKISFQNIGLKEGIIKSVYIANGSKQVQGTCSLPKDANGYLGCVDGNGTSLELVDFPYRVKDLDNCLEATIKGIEGIGLEKNCEFELIFQESYQSLPKSYTAYVLGLNYDSTYENQETLKSADFLTFSVQSLNTACIGFEALSFELFSGDVFLTPAGNCLASQRQTTIEGSEISVVKLKVANPKKWTVNVTNFSDQPISSLEIVMDGQVLSSTGKNLNSTYQQAATTCTDSLGNGQICTVGYDFSLLESTKPQENAQAFDEVIDADNQIGYKYIDVFYNDGANLLDDGVNPLAKKRTRLKVKMKIERRGYLVAQVDKEGTVVHVGDSPNLPELRTITLVNQGSKDIPYIKILANYDEILPTNYGIKILESSSCLSYVSPNITSEEDVTVSPLATQLPAGASCELNIHMDQKVYEDASRTTFAADPDIDKLTNFQSMYWYNSFASGLTTEELLSGTGAGTQRFSAYRTYRETFRDFNVSKNNTMDAWEQNSRLLKMDFDFVYYNGDEDADGAIPGLGLKRTIENRSSPISLGVNIKRVGKLIPLRVFPYGGAWIYRPSVTLPALNIPEYLAIPKDGPHQPYYAERYIWAIDTVPKASTIRPLMYNNYPIVPRVLGGYMSYVHHVSSWYRWNWFKPIFFHARENSIPTVKTIIENELPNESNIDYAVHFGSFPATKLDGSAVDQNLAFTFYNKGSVQLRITDITFEKKGTVPAFNYLTNEVVSGKIKVNANRTFSVGIELSTTVPGLYTEVLEIKYESGGVNSTKRIMLIAEVIDNFPRLNIKTRDYLVESTIVDGDVTVSEQLDPDVKGDFNDDEINYNPKGSYSSGFNFNTDVIKLQTIQGSPVYAKKRVEIINTSATETMKTLRVYLGAKMGSSKSSLLDKETIYHTTEGSSIHMSRPETGGCFDRYFNTARQRIESLPSFDLGPGQSCFVDVSYEASFSAQETFHELGISYQIQDGQFTLRKLIIHFEPFPPANIIVDNVSKVSVEDNSTGVLRNSYPVSFGGQSDPSHVNLVNYPEIATRGCETCLSQMRVLNNATKKASLLSAYREFNNNPDATIPANGNKFKIATRGQLSIFANRACFFGDDENNNAILDDEKGIDFQTVAECYLTVEHSFFGQSLNNYAIEEGDTLVRISYYNNKRLTTDAFYLHATGFVEPNKMVLNLTEAESDYYDVEVSSLDEISFSWPKLDEQTSEWGPLTSYRVFYSSNKDAFNNVYRTDASFVDVQTESVTFNPGQFNTGDFVYFKVAAVRVTNGTEGITYISETPLDTLQVVIPPANMSYIHKEKILLSHSKSADLMSKADAQSECQSQTVELLNNNLIEPYSMSLMGPSEWSYIESDSELSDYSNPTFSPHWTTEVSNIETVLDENDLFDLYDPSIKIQAFPPSDSIIYIKTCTNSSACNFLSLIRGGEESLDLYENGYLYVDGAQFDKGFARCVVELP